MTREPTLGAAVVTSDGKALGEVKKVEAGAFQVNAPRQLDYWLELTIVGSCEASTVTLTVAEADLGGYKMDRPNDHNAFRDSHAASVDPANVRARTMRR